MTDQTMIQEMDKMQEKSRNRKNVQETLLLVVPKFIKRWGEGPTSQDK
jgi:hypothetical protein